jgi:poly-gamma-glutamate capsule biosynthesis protein CapA/YwtB (metallophosphatase superfamily)
MFRYILPLSLLTFSLWGCKTNQAISTSNANIPVLDAKIEEDSVFVIPVAIDSVLNTNDSIAHEVEKVAYDTITIVSVGDIMMGTNFPNSSFLPLNNGSDLWDESRELLKSADIAFGNLEGTMLDGEGQPKECKNPAACYLFRMPSTLASNLVECGFDIMSIANNHANDFGKVGRISTQTILDSLQIMHAGSEEKPYQIGTINGLKVGFVAFSPNKGTLTFYDTAQAIKIIKDLKSNADIVIVSIHGGAEGRENLHVTRKREFYFGEDRGNIYEFSHLMIDKGADMILGHGPHVPRAIEVYKKRLIAYSLGNFCTYGRFNLKGENAEAPLLKTRVNSQGELIDGTIYAFKQSYSDGPKIDPTKKVIKTISELSQEDFPENEIYIDDNGRIIYLQN